MYAGLDGVYRVAMGVEESRHRLHRLLFTERCLVRAAAGWFVAASDWEAKQVLARHLWEDAEHMWSLYERCLQLRGSGSALHKPPDARLEHALLELAEAPDELSFLAGIYDVIKPALIIAYRQHLAETHGVADQPTVRLLRQVLLEEEEQVGLVEGVRRAGVADRQSSAVAAWCSHLRHWLTSCGDILGEGPLPDQEPAKRLAGTFTLPRRPGRDGRFTAVLEHKGTAADLEHVGRLERIQRTRLFEMAAAEVPAGVLFERSDVPLAFCRDAARQIWDEVRHSMFGQAAIEAEGGSLDTYPAFVGDYTFTRPLPPADRYVWLTIGLENRFMKYPPGKRSEFEFCRDEAQHPLMAMFQDYDWADEVIHAQMGRRWAPVLLGNHATLQEAQELGDHLVAEFRQWIKQQVDADSRPAKGSGQPEAIRS